eukprot:1750381-Pyramimonas_sp.AAC.1
MFARTAEAMSIAQPTKNKRYVPYSVFQVSMMSAELLGTLERVVSAAVRVRGTHKKRAGESHRAFGEVNVVMCADFWQLHPATGTFLASNPLDVPA